MIQRSENREMFSSDPDKSYGLMEIVDGTSVMVEKEPEETVFTWPHLVMLEIAWAMVAFLILHVVATYFNAPLEDIANSSVTPNPAKAPWYFLGLQEMVSWSSPFWGGILLPGVVVLIGLVLPFVDRSPAGVGRWFARERWLANALWTVFVVGSVTVILIGLYCRGPNWHFYWPWQPWPTTH